MSSQPFSDVRVSMAPSLSMSDPCGLPLKEGNHDLRQNPIELFSCEKPGDKELPTMVDAKTQQAATDPAVAYGKFTKTTEGTPEYYQALESFILLLFPECNPPTNVLPEAQRPEAPPGHEV
jgi:hypothetical protein